MLQLHNLPLQLPNLLLLLLLLPTFLTLLAAWQPCAVSFDIKSC